MLPGRLNTGSHGERGGRRQEAIGAAAPAPLHDRGGTGHRRRVRARRADRVFHGQRPRLRPSLSEHIPRTTHQPASAVCTKEQLQDADPARTVDPEPLVSRASPRTPISSTQRPLKFHSCCHLPSSPPSVSTTRRPSTLAGIGRPPMACTRSPSARPWLVRTPSTSPRAHHFSSPSRPKVSIK